MGHLKTRTRACFENKLITNPAEIVCYACALMKYWASSYSKEYKEILLKGVNIMLYVATRLLTTSTTSSATLKIEDAHGLMGQRNTERIDGYSFEAHTVQTLDVFLLTF